MSDEICMTAERFTGIVKALYPNRVSQHRWGGDWTYHPADDLGKRLGYSGRSVRRFMNNEKPVPTVVALAMLALKAGLKIEAPKPKKKAASRRAKA